MTAETAQRSRNSPWRLHEVPALRKILPAFGVSKIGDLLYAAAVMAVVLERTGSAAWVSAAIIATLVPNALLTPFAGVLADRMDRRRLMVLTDVGRLVLMIVAAVLVATKAPIVLFVVVVFLSASVATPFMSSLMASLPELVEEDRLPAANAAINMLYNVGILVGPVLATFILGTDVLWLPFALNAVTFAVSAAMLSSVRRATRREQAAADASGTAPDADAGDAGPTESFMAAFVTGLRTAVGNRFLLFVMIVVVPVSFGWGLNRVLLPLVSQDVLGTGAAGVGILMAANGLGGLLATGYATRLAGRDRLLAILAVSCIMSVVPMALLAVVDVPVVAYVIILLEGVAFMVLEVVWVTALQRILPLDQLARVDSLFQSLSVGVSLLGSFATPLVVALVGVRGALVVALVVGALGSLYVLAVASGVRLVRPDRDLTAFLRTVRPLDGLDEPGYESLATAAAPSEQVPAGTTLLTAGEPATEVLVLVSGTADVLATSRDGAPLAEPVLVNQVRGPDLLGEIGVIGRRPRTASVVTTSEAVVRRIPAAAFEAVVAPGVGMPNALEIAVGARLGRWPG